MGACDTWNVEINILVYENETFSLPAEFHFNEGVLFRTILSQLRISLSLPFILSGSILYLILTLLLDFAFNVSNNFF